MTDPERISRRGAGLAARLLQSSAEEQPHAAGMQRTLAALGVSGAVWGATSAAGAATAASGKGMTALLLVKWVGVGVVSGVGLAGAAALVSSPVSAPRPALSASASKALPPLITHTPSVAPRASEPAAPVVEAEPPAPAITPRASAPAPSVSAPPDMGAPLAEEVAFVDRARAALAAGRTEAGLAELSRYEQAFPEARLLPEVLFLQLEAYERQGRSSEARRAAQRLVSGFPRSPHAARARSLLKAHFP